MASPSRSYQSAVAIDAEPADVWAVLTDVKRWPEWVANVERVDGELAHGARVVVHAVEANYRDVAVEVTSIDEPHLLRLEGRLFLGSFRFGRSYTLQTLDGGVTRFEIHEEHSGPLAGPAAKRTGDLQPWFDDFATSLKARVESGV